MRSLLHSSPPTIPIDGEQSIVDRRPNLRQGGAGDREVSSASHDAGKPRAQVAAPLTHEVLARVIAELAGE